jgi:hypothetical protein
LLFVSPSATNLQRFLSFLSFKECAMRLISLLILVAIVGGGAFVFFFKPEWIGMAQKKAKEAFQTHVEGYGPAKSPREAMDQFLKAVKARNYNAAAVYATKDYAEELTKAHDGARALGEAIDKVSSYLEEKQLGSEKATQLLVMLDPFPAAYLEGSVKEVKGKKDENAKQVAAFLFKPPAFPQGYRPDELRSLDPKIIGLNALGAPTLSNLGLHQFKSEGEGDAMAWKIDFQVNEQVHEAIKYFNSNYKRYVSAMDNFRTTLRTGNMLREKVAPELLEVLGSSK